MKHKAVIFDIDGTLLDSVDPHAESWRRTFLRFGRDIPFADIRAQIGKGGDQLLPVFFSEREVALIGKVMEKTRGNLFKSEFLEHYAKLLEIDDLIETGTSTDDAEKSKPHPDIFEAALEKLGKLSPKDCLVLGDTPYDAEAAGKAGIKTVGVLCGGFPEADLKKAGVIAIYQDPEELLRRYDGSPFAK